MQTGPGTKPLFHRLPPLPRALATFVVVFGGGALAVRLFGADQRLMSGVAGMAAVAAWHAYEFHDTR